MNGGITPYTIFQFLEGGAFLGQLAPQGAGGHMQIIGDAFHAGIEQTVILFQVVKPRLQTKYLQTTLKAM